MRRGDVYLVDLDPTRGAEAKKTRPAVLVSNDAANRAAHRNGRGVVTVVPLTSNTSHIFAFQVLIRAGQAGLDHDSKAQAEHLRSVDYGRLIHRLGALEADSLVELDDAVRVHLAV